MIHIDRGRIRAWARDAVYAAVNPLVVTQLAAPYLLKLRLERVAFRKLCCVAMPFEGFPSRRPQIDPKARFATVALRGTQQLRMLPL